MTGKIYEALACWIMNRLPQTGWKFTFSKNPILNKIMIGKKTRSSVTDESVGMNSKTIQVLRNVVVTSP